MLGVWPVEATIAFKLVVVPEVIGAADVQVKPELLCKKLPFWATATMAWVVLGLVVLAIFLAFSRYGDLKLGDEDDEPEFSVGAWFSMLFILTHESVTFLMFFKSFNSFTALSISLQP